MTDSGALILSGKSEGAGANLQWRSWMPPGQPRAIALIAHGYAEHIGRYEHVAAHLNAHGLGVYAIDHWGHGKSDGARGFVPRFSVFLDGMAALLGTVETQHPGTPLFLIGHSMGGLIAASHLVTHQSHYAGAILSGPAISAAQEPSRFMIVVSRLLSRFFPSAGVLALDAGGVSRDPGVVAAYLADPLVYTGKMSARLAAEMFDAMAHVRARAADINLPMLLLHGDADRLTAPKGSEFLARHVGSTDKTLKLYPGLYHEIFNEPEQAAVLADLTGWIETRLKGSAPA